MLHSDSAKYLKKFSDCYVDSFQYFFFLFSLLYLYNIYHGIVMENFMKMTILQYI